MSFWQKVKCRVFGRHDYTTIVRCVTLDAPERLCLNCGKRQQQVYDMTYGCSYWQDA